MIYAPADLGFAWSVSSISSTRPAAAMGTAVTPSATANTKGTYVEILSGATLARDVFGLLININSFAVSATAKDGLLDVGVDPAGGSSYTVLIPDLLMSCASPYNVLGGGHWYYFPIWIKAGSSVAARIACNATSGTQASVYMAAYGSPFDPSSVKVGTYVFSAGVTSASSKGTAVTAGTASEGSWTTLATSTAKAAWWWQLGMGCNDSTMAAVQYHADLGIGDGSNKQVVIENEHYAASTTEQLSGQLVTVGNEFPAKAGVNVYGRLWCSGTADSNLSLAGYGLGG